MILIFIRTFKESFKNLWRNGLLSVASISIIAVSLCLISLVYLATSSANNIIRDFQQKVNISVYFKSDVSEENILKVKKDLENYSEIKLVEYVSKEKALEDFKRNNADNPVIMKSLEEIGDNPLLASLNIRAGDPNQYESVAEYVSNAPFKDDVFRVNYAKNKPYIDKLNSSAAETKKVGLAIASLFGLMATLITFNTIRITIYTRKQEVEVMRLVGASNTFIRLPFIFEGITYGIVASLISTALLFVSLKFLMPLVSLKTIPASILLSAFYSDFLIVLALQLFIGVVIGVFSGIIAIRKYLKI
jgi:cell division transport system permease protein